MIDYGWMVMLYSGQPLLLLENKGEHRKHSTVCLDVDLDQAPSVHLFLIITTCLHLLLLVLIFLLVLFFFYM